MATQSGGATLTDDDRYTAITRRDGVRDGQFFYGVQTIGVYCRPSCAGRLVLRRKVSFYPTCEAAGRAGFLACERCRPNEPSQHEPHAEIVRQACRLIDQAEEIPSLNDIAREVGAVPSTSIACSSRSRASRPRDTPMRAGPLACKTASARR